MVGKSAGIAILAAALIALASAGQAQQALPCGKFAWPLDQEKAWFSGTLKTLRSGDAIAQLGDGAYAIEMQPMGAVKFQKPPETDPKSDQAYGAVIAVSNVPSTARYQVTLSDEAWIDILQNGAFAESVEHSGVKGCEGLRKSVRFAFEKGPLTLQLSGAPSPKLRLALKRLD